MEIVKQNETYNITDILNEWFVSGSITTDSNGITYANLNINDGMNQIGYYNINISKDNMTNVNITALPQYIDVVTDYSQEALKKIKEYLANLNSTNVTTDKESTSSDN